MESIYIENYLSIPVKEKVDFLESIAKSDDFKISKQEVVFCEESIIIDLKKNSDVNKACTNIKDYFKKNSDIKVDKIKKMRDKASKTILHFDDSKSKIRI